MAQRALRRHQGARVIAIRAAAGWAGPSELELENRTFEVLDSDSPLEVRSRLVALEDGDRGLALLTRCADRDLGSDVLARMAHGRVLPVDPLRMLEEAFSARASDPRLARSPWIAEALLEAAPARGFSPARGGFLDRDTAFRTLAGVRFGLTAERPDAIAVLAWTLEAAPLKSLRGAPAEWQEGLREWLIEQAGPLAGTILDTIAAGYGRDAVALGIACRVLHHEARETEPALREASVRLERFTGHRPVKADVARQWADAAETTVSELERLGKPDAARQVLAQADALLKELGAERWAGLSRLTPRGFAARLGRLAASVQRWVTDGPDALPLSELERAVSAVREHAEAEFSPDRARRASMALRLVRWLAAVQAEAAAPATLAEAAAAHVGHDGFADWARSALAGGDPEREVAEAYGALLRRVSEVREQRNRQFAERLAAWLQGGAPVKGLLPIEQVLDAVVAPLARSAPVLLLVLDGMSHAIFRQLVGRELERHWSRVSLSGEGGLPPVIAALPTVTEVCRTSLLCGKLRTGTALDEAAGFAHHAALAAASSSSHPPRLVHKAGLLAADSLDIDGELRDLVAEPKQRVVGVVINAVDDHLLKGDQTDIPWSLSVIRGLDILLELARQAGRVVVVTADHGHVLDRSTKASRQEAHDRYRTATEPIAEYELRLAGPRVLIPPGGPIAAAWSEAVRYSTKKNGYHGGIAPQEVVVPLGILRPADLKLPGWPDLPPDTPLWWDAPSGGAAPVATSGTEPTPTAPPVPPVTPTPPAGPKGAWIDRLLATELYREQEERARRVLGPESETRTFLAAMQEAGGTLPLQALARQLAKAPASARPFIAAMQRLFNVDAYAIVGFDLASATVTLNLSLLRRQFGVDGENNHGDHP